MVISSGDFVPSSEMVASTMFRRPWSREVLERVVRPSEELIARTLPVTPRTEGDAALVVVPSISTSDR